MKYFLVLLILAVGVYHCRAQNSSSITYLEYYLDQDPGYGHGTQVTDISSTDLEDLTFTIPIDSGLPNGLHHLFIRSKDSNSNWSQTVHRTFYKDQFAAEEVQKVSSIEYFIDEDPGVGHGAKLTMGNVNSVMDFTFSVHLSNLLTNGTHKLYIRAQNEDGKWSMVHVTEFEKRAEELLYLTPSQQSVTSFIPDNLLYDLITPSNEILASVQGENLTNSLTPFTASVIIDENISNINSQPMLQRHFELTPGGTNPTSAEIILYASKPEMIAFNAASSVKLPAEATDNKSDLRVWQWHGSTVSNNPDEIIDPADSDIEWDTSLDAWKIKFEVAGFSSFFITAEGATALPVTLLNFKAQKQENSVALNWQTTEETNSERFEIQHSTNGKKWTGIGWVRSHGESNTLKSYTYLHLNPVSEDNLYRLKMIDKDATFAMSRIVYVHFDMPSDISLFPNPAGNLAIVRSSKTIKEYQLLSSAGHTIRHKEQLKAKQVEVPLDHVSTGIYVLRLLFEDGKTEYRKLAVE